MSLLLLVIGAITAVLGVGMVGYGLPVHEFSFGNTLIVAGTTATVGGLIVIALGAAVGQLQRIAEILAAHSPVHASQPVDMFEPQSTATADTGRVSFPPRPKAETSIREPLRPLNMPAHAESAAEDQAATAPMLRNPAMAAAVEEYVAKEYEDVSLSPQQAIAAPAHADLGEAPATTEQRSGNGLDASWRSAPPQRPPQTSYFDAMWPAEPKLAWRPASEEIRPASEPPPAVAQQAQRTDPPPAILKSGVVDGMAYTLYVDGSIEAELPQGTLHFASINELRGHLAKNS